MLISNWESSDNRGDLAILEAQIDLLEKAGRNVAILGNQPKVMPHSGLRCSWAGCVPWPAPGCGGLLAWTRGLLGFVIVMAIGRWASWGSGPWPQLVRQFLTVSEVMPKGGGYLYALPGPRSTLFLLRTAAPLFLAKRLHVKRVVWGHSVGPAEGRISRWLLRVALDGADVAVRDEDSLELCHSLGLLAKRIPDLAFNWASVTLPRGSSRDGLVVGVTARRISRDSQAQNAYEDAMVRALEALHAIHDVDVYFRLIPQVVGPTSYEDDRVVLTSIGARLPNATLVGPLPEATRSLLQVYGDLDVLVGTRTHSLILAACCGVPFAGLEYIGGKASGVAADLGAPWLVVKSADELESVLLDVTLHLEAYRESIIEGARGARQRLALFWTENGEAGSEHSD